MRVQQKSLFTERGLRTVAVAKDNVAGVVVRSGLAGVVSTILAVAIGSPAGLGGMIGVAEGMGFATQSADAADSLNLPVHRQQLTAAELSLIQSTLQRSDFELDMMRSATDADMEYMRSLAESANLQLRD